MHGVPAQPVAYLWSNLYGGFSSDREPLIPTSMLELEDADDDDGVASGNKSWI